MDIGINKDQDKSSVEAPKAHRQLNQIPTSASSQVWVSQRSLKRLLFLSDFLGLAIFLQLAFVLRLGHWSPLQLVAWPTALYFVSVLGALYVADVYKLDRLDSRALRWRISARTLAAVASAAAIVVLTFYLLGLREFSGLTGRGILLGSFLGFSLWAMGWRLAMLSWLMKRAARMRWLLLGSPRYLTTFLYEILKNDVPGQVVCAVEDGYSHPLQIATKQGALEGGIAVTFNRLKTVDEELTTHSRNYVQASWKDIQSLLSKDWAGIVLCADQNLNQSLVDQLMQARFRGIRVYDLTDFYEALWQKVPIYYLQGGWFALTQGFQLFHSPLGPRIKRLVDIGCALALLTLTLPLMLITAIAIRLETKGPVIFRQRRVGEGHREFTLLKFRSMRPDAEATGAQWAKANDDRVTGVGRLIRLTRIDELPQLWNVLRGEMSFIGPRPERPEFTEALEKQIPFYNLRHLVRPGITGWAQVLYPYGASVEDARQKLQYDLFYIKNYSLSLDLVILFKTVRVVLFGRGR